MKSRWHIRVGIVMDMQSSFWRVKGNDATFSDLLPTHAHQNVLWVMAYDDYPMTSIENKQKWVEYGAEKEHGLLLS